MAERIFPYPAEKRYTEKTFRRIDVGEKRKFLLEYFYCLASYEYCLIFKSLLSRKFWPIFLFFLHSVFLFFLNHSSLSLSLLLLPSNDFFVHTKPTRYKTIEQGEEIKTQEQRKKL